MSKRCIVSFGKGYNFEKGLDRLQKNIDDIVKVPFVRFTEYPENCPDHKVSPFAFKFYCIKECAKKYDTILWVDSSVIIKNNLEEIFNTLDNQGYFFIRNHHSVGEYCHDKALDTLKIDRDLSFKIPCVQGTQFGLNFKFENTHKFLDKIIDLANDGITFPGPYTNENNIASIHEHVCGHRHDQTAMSVEALRLDMNQWWQGGESQWFIHDRSYVKDCDSTVVDIRMSY